MKQNFFESSNNGCWSLIDSLNAERPTGSMIGFFFAEVIDRFLRPQRQDACKYVRQRLYGKHFNLIDFV